MHIPRLPYANDQVIPTGGVTGEHTDTSMNVPHIPMSPNKSANNNLTP
ncbi:MAG: hypothetical protein ACYC8S_00375 [Minisyncoccota bacterium]